MDTFFEQIVYQGKDTKKIFMLIGIWILALLVSALLLLLGPTVFTLMLIGFAFYGAYRLSARLYIEYEYIITNGTMDIDKIIAKSSRKRMASFDISQIEVIEKYNCSAPKSGFNNVVVACNEKDPDAYKMVVVKEGKGKTLIVFAPNEKIKRAVVKSLPRFIANSAFKE